MESRFRQLPSVERLVSLIEATEPTTPRPLIAAAARETIDAARRRIVDESAVISSESLMVDVRDRLQRRLTPTLRPVINATGIILHTNLGRALLSSAATRAMVEVGSSYTNLEFDLDGGARGSRTVHSRELLRELTGAEDALVVNNNAGALLLALSALAAGREVIVSRSQAVEIGGGFRIPDVMQQSGARLVEIGTTNRTYASDYERAIGPETGLLLRVHSSNFRIEGFVHTVGIDDLAAIGNARGVCVLDDVGSGALIDPAVFGLAEEPLVQSSVQAGSTIVCFSGDKLLGGPQAGLIVGRAGAIDKIRRHPLARALRIDKLSLAALEATLRHYQRGEAVSEIPLWRMVATPIGELERRARQVQAALGLEAVRVVETRSAVGGGSLPGETLASWGLKVSWAGINRDWSADRCARSLRQLKRPIVARVEKDSIVIDLRTVDPTDDDVVGRAIVSVAPEIE